jgi:WD40 repeat protein
LRDAAAACEQARRAGDFCAAPTVKADLGELALLATRTCTPAAMPTTRAARRAAAARLLLELPADVLSLVLYQLPLAHDIALTGLTCRTLCNAAKLALKLRPYSSEVVTLAGHAHPLISVAATPDGHIITGSEDETAKVWRDGTCVRTIELDAPVGALAVLRCGSRFLSGTDDQCIKLWSIDGALEWEVEAGEAVCSLAVFRDGLHFVVGIGTFTNDNNDEEGGEIRLYHVNGTLVHAFTEAASGWMTEVVVTRDDQHIISASEDMLVKVWSVASKSLLSTCAEHTSAVDAVAAMPDGQRMLSGSRNGEVRVWLLDGTLENTFSELHPALVRAIVTLSDNQHAISAASDKTVKLFDVNDGAVLRTFTHHRLAVYCLALLPDGLRFVSASDDKTACIFELGLAPQ